MAGAALPSALGTWAFVALGLLLAGTLRAEAVLGAANLLWVLLLVGGGVVVPPDLLPGPLAALAPLLPSGALGDGLRAVARRQGLPLGRGARPGGVGGRPHRPVARTFRWS